MKQYHDFLNYILDNGVKKSDRTGTGTLSTFVPPAMRFDLSKGFPLVTTKKLHTKSIFHELVWFLRGDTNIKYLNDNGVTIWDEWADERGNLGPIYGAQWRRWEKRLTGSRAYETVDQITWLIQEIKKNPNSRRLILSAWNVGQLEEMRLPPCHMISQFYVVNGKLSCHLNQRSADAFLGVPFNIASYAALTHLMAHWTGLKPGNLVHTCGDAHLYLNHLEQAKLQLSRDPEVVKLPRFHIEQNRDFTPDTISFDDFRVEGYYSFPAISAPVAI